MFLLNCFMDLSVMYANTRKIFACTFFTYSKNIEKLSCLASEFDFTSFDFTQMESSLTQRSRFRENLSGSHKSMTDVIMLIYHYR